MTAAKFSSLLLVVTFFQLTISECTSARELRWSQEVSESRRLPYMKVLGSISGLTYTLRSDAPMPETMESSNPRTRRFQLQCYSENMSLVWEKEIQYPIEDASIFHMSVLGSRILVVCISKREGSPVRDIYAQFLSEDGSFVGIPILVDEVPLDRIDMDRLPDFFR
ncbi:MAG: hypothetical protein ACKO7B_03045, partial [Flavobacteriales bacterium]